MIVLGQVAKGVRVEQLRVGMRVQVVLETLFVENQIERLVWKWAPVPGVGAYGRVP